MRWVWDEAYDRLPVKEKKDALRALTTEREGRETLLKLGPAETLAFKSFRELLLRSEGKEEGGELRLHALINRGGERPL